jgi:hypothetical protein
MTGTDGNFEQVDTIMRVMFDKQLRLVDSEEEEPPFLSTLRTFSANFFLTKHFPILATIAVNIPVAWSERLLPGYAQFRKVRLPFTASAIR